MAGSWWELGMLVRGVGSDEGREQREQIMSEWIRRQDSGNTHLINLRKTEDTG